MSRRTILLVCTANVCRSPMAEHLLRHALAAEPGPLSGLTVRSAGVAAYTGDRASPNSVRALKAVGLDLAEHRSEPLTQKMLDETLALFAMTPSHLRAVSSQFMRTPPHMHLMREFVEPGKSKEIPDPFGAGLDEYEECRDAMIEAIPGIVRRLREIFPENPLSLAAGADAH